VEFKTRAVAGLDKAATELASDLDSTLTELDAVLEYSLRGSSRKLARTPLTRLIVTRNTERPNRNLTN